VLLVGDRGTLERAAELVGVARSRLLPYRAGPTGGATPGGKSGLYLCEAGPILSDRDRKPGRPSKRSGAAQLCYVTEGARLARELGSPLVTAAVSKAAIAHSGAPGAESFRGHTEWLQAEDRAKRVTMCFWTERFSTSLVTTHLPLERVPSAIDASGVRTSTVHLAQLLGRLGVRRPRIAVCSLNPHAGEGGMFGVEEKTAILPGMAAARRELGASRSQIELLGAETAYRLAQHGNYDGVVAMYHDQATIPTKLVAFGDAVNVTMGLSYTRTSVDHGTAYDIAWQGIAEPSGLRAAMTLAARMTRPGRRRTG
jgi:4-hydroxythreonine-4-phosphate dehydrogenase